MRIKNLLSFTAFVTLVMGIIIGGLTRENGVAINAKKEAITNIHFSPIKDTGILKAGMPFLISNF